MPLCPVNHRCPRLSKTAVLRLAFGRSFGSGKRVTASVFGSTRTIAFWPPSVIHAAWSGPMITPCGADPAPSGTRSALPLRGSSRPAAPCACAVYHTVPSGAGATSCGALPAGTANVSNDGGCAGAEPMAMRSAAPTSADAKDRAGPEPGRRFAAVPTGSRRVASMSASRIQDAPHRASTASLLHRSRPRAGRPGTIVTAVAR